MAFVKFTVATRKEDGKKFINVVNDQDVQYPVSTRDVEASIEAIKANKIKMLSGVTLREGQFGKYATLPSDDYEQEEL